MFASTHVCALCECLVPLMAKEGIGSPGNGVTDVCRPLLLYGCWKSNLGPLEKVTSALKHGPISLGPTLSFLNSVEQRLVINYDSIVFQCHKVGLPEASLSNGPPPSYFIWPAFSHARVQNHAVQHKKII